MKTLGYLGLGVMGYGMTGNLIDKSGCDIYGYDPVPALRERFAARGGKVLDDAKTLYKTCTKACDQKDVKKKETKASCACPPTPS